MVFASFFFNDTTTTGTYTLSLHDALPISVHRLGALHQGAHLLKTLLKGLLPGSIAGQPRLVTQLADGLGEVIEIHPELDRKSTRLNSSHANISYAVFCLKKKHIAPTIRAL